MFRDEEVFYVEDKCETKTSRRCEKYWKMVSDNRKVWEENPDKCQNVLETKCSPVTNTRVNKIPYQDCIKVPYETCKQVDENICNDVTKERCVLEPNEECQNIPRQECRLEHKLIPNQISRQIQVRVCDDEENGRRPIIQPTEQPPVRIFNNNQGKRINRV